LLQKVRIGKEKRHMEWKRTMVGMLAALSFDALMPVAADTMPDTWAAVDALGRELPGEGDAPALRADRFVGMFYYIWIGAHGYARHMQPPVEGQGVCMPAPGDPSPYVIPEIIKEPVGRRKWGPKHAFHHWGEPLFGFYVSNDEWVIRKHAQILADAGVDVIVLDATNGLHYRDTYMEILRIYADIRAKGGRTPAISFITRTGHEKVVQKLHDDLYSKGLYRDLWFIWKGKPLLMASPEGLGEALKAFFSLRSSWAWTRGQKWFGDGRDRWPWLDNTPQQYGWHESPGKPEQIVVCAAEHPDTNRGKSFHNGANPKPHRTELGLYFSEQWKRALEVDPEFVFITQWNEWIAMRFTKDDINRDSYMGVTDYDPEAVFVDVFDMEFNRDIEPMKGGYGDNYYYQTWQNIRRFKGVRPLPASSRELPVRWDPRSGATDPWAAIRPEYRDDVGDTFHRDHFGYGGTGRLVNTSGRNDIRLCKVARNRTTLWFMAETAGTLTDPSGGNWMTLHVGVEGDARPSWCGFAFKIQPQADGKSARLFMRTAEETWQAKAMLPCTVEENRVIMALPRELLGKRADVLRFKWSDHVPGNDPLEWWTDGDTAPNGRAAYRYRAGKPQG
jgi:hypothetical protein